MRLCFVAAEGGSAFMLELLEVVAEASRGAGAVATVHVGAYPVVSEPCAYVVIPHEYFVLTPPAAQPDAEQRSRTIAFCVEHPGNATFEVGARHAATLGAAMDINLDSTVALQAAGVAAHHFTLGYSTRWDTWHGEDTAERPIDLTYMGTTDSRRDFLLARQAEGLSGLATRLLIPPHEMMTGQRADFLLGDDKLRSLAASKTLLNLHRGASRSLEWVRVLEAMCNGCVVVSETSVAFDPLVPGRHVLFAHALNTVAVATALVRHPERAAAVRDGAYELVQTLDMQGSARLLVELAEALAAGRRGPAPSAPPAPTARPLSIPPIAEPPRPPDGLPRLSMPWTGVPLHVRQEQVRLIELTLARRSAADVAVVAPNAGARVSALIPLAGDARSAAVTSRSLYVQDPPVVVRTARPTEPLADAQPFSRGQVLNAMLAEATGEYVLVIEPGQELFETGVRNLVTALDVDGDADAAYGLMADVQAGTLWNALPLEEERLRRRVYLSAPFLARRHVLAELNGFATDAALIGYEYHDFWLRFARSGRTAAFVQQVVGRGQPVVAPELSVARLTPERTLAALGSVEQVA